MASSKTKGNIFFSIFLILIFIIFVVVYVDFKPKSKFSIFVNRKAEAIMHFIFRNQEARQKNIEKLEKSILENKKLLSQLKEKLKLELESLETSTHTGENIKIELGETNNLYQDYLSNIKAIYHTFGNEIAGVEIPKNSEEAQINFFSVFLANEDRAIKKREEGKEIEYMRLTKDLANEKNEKENCQKMIEDISSRIKKMSERNEEEKKRKEKLNAEKTKYCNDLEEIDKKIFKAEESIANYENKTTELRSNLVKLEEIFVKLKDVYSRKNKLKDDLKKVIPEINKKKKKVDDVKNEIKEQTEIVDRDEKYLQKLKANN